MQVSDELKSHIDGKLNEGEVILWAGKPSGVKLLDMPYGTQIIIRWIIGLIFVVFGLWYQLIFLPGAANPGMSGSVFMLVCFAIAAIIALLPFMDIYRLNSRCSYYITNQRALSLFRASADKHVLKEKKYADISEITSDTFAEGRGNIYIGTKMKNSVNRARAEILSPPVSPEDGGNERPLIFHSVAAPDEVLGFFPPLNADSKGDA